MPPSPQRPGDVPPTIFDLLHAYQRSLDSMRHWLDDAEISDLERISIVDAWQDEMKRWFYDHGYCFACNKSLGKCGCG